MLTRDVELDDNLWARQRRGEAMVEAVTSEKLANRKDSAAREPGRCRLQRRRSHRGGPGLL
jgi:hypothetical protein